MGYLLDAIGDWLKEMLVSGIISNLSGMFDSVNQKVGEVAGEVGMTPQAWNSGIYNMVKSLSETVILPIAGLVLAFVMTLELIQILMDKNNFHDIETFVFFKWMFKTACAILIVSNTWNIVMAVFDVTQRIVSQSAGVIVGSTSNQKPVSPPVRKRRRSKPKADTARAWTADSFSLRKTPFLRKSASSSQRPLPLRF